MLPRAAAGERPKDIPMLFAYLILFLCAVMVLGCVFWVAHDWARSRRIARERYHCRPVGPPPPDHPNCRCQVVPLVQNAAPDDAPPPHWIGGAYDPLNLGVVSLGLDQADSTDRSSGSSCDATGWAGTSNWSGEPSFDWSGGGDSGGSGASGNWD